MKRNLIRYLWPAVLVTATVLPAHGQTDIMEGGHVVIASGATLTSMVTINIAPGGSLVNDGMLCVKRDLHNQNSGKVNLGPGIFNFCGEVSQTLSGDNTMGGLLMDNPAGMTLAGSTEVMGLLTLASGRMTLGVFHLTLGMQAMVAGSPSAASMVVTTSTGEFRKSFAGPGTFQFPVGDVYQDPDYSPVTLTFTAGTGVFASDNYVGVSLVNQKYPDPNVTGNYLNRYWNLSHSGITGFSCTAWFSYTDADVTGEEGLLACTRVSPLPWTTFEPANITDNILMATGITFFSTAGGAAFSSFTGFGNSTLPANLQLTNMVIPAGTSECYAATQVLMAGGGGGTFMVMPGGAVDLVAGQVVSFQPLAGVPAGGYLHAWISAEGQFCGGASRPIVAALSTGTGLPSSAATVADHFLRIYPNPASDMVFIEFGQDVPSTVSLEVYHTNGLKVFARQCAGEARIQVSLGEWPAGIYLVYVRSERRTGFAKIVRNNE